jgi:Outer membrane protein beta-barrel domain
MRNGILVAFFCACAGTALGAEAARSNGYVFVAPGGETAGGYTNKTLHLGVGGEYVIGKGIGVGGDVGALGLTRNYASTVLFTLSPTGFYHLPIRSERIDPYVLGGYTLFARDGQINLFHFGGGVNYWLRPRLGFKGEFRDQVYQPDNPIHYWNFRMGLTFR